MAILPDEAIVVRGGQYLSANFEEGSGVVVDDAGKVQDVSVNCAPGLTVEELTTSNSKTGHPGVPHRQVRVTTVGAIRAAGGNIVPAPTRKNPYHSLLHGLTPEEASALFRPTVRNPHR